MAYRECPWQFKTTQDVVTPSGALMSLYLPAARPLLDSAAAGTLSRQTMQHGLRVGLAALMLLSALRPAVGAQSPSTATSATLFTSVRVFDGEKVLGRRDVLVRNGRIAAVAPSLANATDAVIVDGTGATLLPGLIDAHAHSYGDALEQALVFGVTTELDMFSDPISAARLRAEQRARVVPGRADLFSAGILATVPKGHGTEYGFPIPTITSPDSAQAFVDARLAQGSDYIKIILDDGSTYGMQLPTLSSATVHALVVAAHARHRLAVVHIGSLADAHTAIDAGADGLEHLFVDREPDASFGQYVAAHHAFVVPTLDVLATLTGTPGAGALAEDPALVPYLSLTGSGTLKATFPLRATASRNYHAAEASVRALKAAGVDIMAGTDAPNPGTAHGISMHRELELLVSAGLTPQEALAAATSVPARRFALTDRGVIRVGARADLLLVDGDPTVHITATRAIRGVWKGGVLLDRSRYAASVTASSRAASIPSARDSGSSRIGKISTFDDKTTATAFGSGWLTTTDQLAGGHSTADMTVVSGGAAGTSDALAVSGLIAPGLPYAWGGAMFMPGTSPMQPTNLSSAKSLHFWAKGDGKTCRVMVFAKSRGGAPIIREFVAGGDWAEYEYPWSSFGGIDGHDVMGIAFVGGPAPGAFRFLIDEVGLR